MVRSSPVTHSSEPAAFTIPADVVARRVGESAVLVRLTTNKIYELNPTGARIWELLSAGKSRGEVLETLASEFDASADELSASFDELIGSLRAEGLV